MQLRLPLGWAVAVLSEVGAGQRFDYLRSPSSENTATFVLAEFGEHGDFRARRVRRTRRRSECIGNPQVKLR
ncbi:hypothetical protein Mal15_13700 [Stieleria maiorica]|uniref:Uncharacterized protein n=1 Tax=Stieleria maiorica TaxID=2795974 RepID=A0A5B9MB68_9BACT|nr:hypothetical protein Mal15_13700 [Stieleria maiorica]